VAKKKKIVRGKSTYGAQTPLRLVHTTPLGGHVWKDTMLGEYRFAPAGVGKRGNNGDDVNVGFSDSLEDAIASLEYTERRMGGNAMTMRERSHNPMIEIPNLDAMTEDDLLIFMQEVADADDDLSRNAYAYANRKLLAMVARRQGNISRAMQYENSADAIYHRIPQKDRW